MRLGLIGATGWLGGALGRHLLAQGVVAPGDLVVLNRSGRRGYEGSVWAADVADLAARADVIVVSVRPQDWAGLDLRAPGRLVISFMAGIGHAALARAGGRVVRAMPNAAAESAGSYSPFWAGPGVDAADRAAVRRILGAIGTSDELPDEAQIDLMTALPGSGAAYPALMAMAMVRFMTDRGVPEAVAWRATEAAVCGGAAMLAGAPQRAEELLAAYRDYAGTTAAGIAAAEAAGFAQAIGRALEAAARKARDIGGPQGIG
ncbi:MAG: pyrroline-5-carboxylate reductase dimerization domain-containing protein [Paracoccus sp. (in: a-proteobacteria)]|uniref:pyrroline-5-carboxylate reductase family protein n=1 Tax=Paracoccus sp. TaxID=267 RepID=UPI0039E3CAA1